MARNNAPKIELTAYDDLFQTDESREEAKLSKIRDIPISQIDEFPDHPFKVLMDEDMEQLVESVKRSGIMTPATVRLKEDGRYELISGHRRKKACELAGLETLKCEVKELTRDEAIIIMVESNLQRSTILPSEKAFAYKMRLEAMKRQAGRPPKEENASPMATNLLKGRSDEELGDLVGESKDQIRRYIRLTELVPEILQMVDERRIAFRPAVEISYPRKWAYLALGVRLSFLRFLPLQVTVIKLQSFNDKIRLLSSGDRFGNELDDPLVTERRLFPLIGFFFFHDGLDNLVREFSVLAKLLHFDSLRQRRGGVVVLHRFKQGVLLFLGQIHACEKLGIETVPALVTELDRDSAVIFMVDSNLQRESLLPSEKAFAYKMKLEALKHQGRASDQLGQKSSVQTVADASSDSKTQVQRYIRLTKLEKPLLDLVDEGRIALTPAVELSYLLPEEQRNLIQTIESEDCTPSLSQSVRMRKLSAEGLLTMDRIFEIMTEVKGNQVEVIKIPTERVRRFFKPTTSYRQMEDYIVKALEYYARYLKKQRDRDSR